MSYFIHEKFDENYEEGNFLSIFSGSLTHKFCYNFLII